MSTQPFNQSIATDDPARALAALSRVGSGPLVVGLQAKDEQDLNKLAVALNDFVSDNSRRKAENDRAIGQLSNNAELRQTQTTAGNIATSGGALIVNGGQAGVQNLNGISTQLSQNSAQIGNGGYVYNNGNSTVTVTSSGGVILNGVNGSLSLGNMGNNTFQQRNGLYNDQQYTNNDQVRNNFAEALQQAAAKGGPYRATLTQSQLDQIFKSYRVTLVARGEEAHVFRVTGDSAPSVADAKERDQVLRRAGYDDVQRDADKARMAAVTVGNTVQEQAPTSQAAAAPLTAPAAAAKAAAEAAYDCVIVIEPPSKAASSPASQR